MSDLSGTHLEQRIPGTSYSYEPDQRVNINLQFIGQEGVATGYIRGIASHVPGLLSVWIVELEQDLPNYPYRCITIPEVALSPAQELLYKDTFFTIRERVINFLSHQNEPVSLSQLHEAMPDLPPGSLDAGCHQLGNAGVIHKVT
ncbi:MAG: hypothetical protein F6K28_27385, partial [Microcoleus sp. SIO2G3]|nr:hypothetical protein [Microcoleus sp. SIO2G3]